MTSGPYGDGTGPLDPYGAPGPGTPPAYPPQGYAAPGYAAPGHPAPGYPPQAYPRYNPQQGVYSAPGVTPMAYGAYPRPRNGLGTAALVLGIIGVVFCWVPFTGWALNILAIIFGAIGRKRAIDGQATNKSSAVAGLVLGVVGLAVWLVIIVVALAAVSTVGTISYS